MNSKKQGAIGVAFAISHYTAQEYAVFIPVSDTSRFDLIIEKDGKLSRVEVKTTKSKLIDLRTSGGNQSWNKVYKKISSEDCDKVFCLNLKTLTWREFESLELEGRSTVTI